MTHPIYSEQQLSQMSRSQLWAILANMGLSPRRSNADCIRVILENQPEPQVEFEQYLEEQVFEITGELKKNGERDRLEGLPMQSVHPAYRLGYKMAEARVEVPAEVQVEELQPTATTAPSNPAKRPSLFDIKSIQAIHQNPGFGNQKHLKTEVLGYLEGLLDKDPASRSTKYHIYYQKGQCDRAWLSNITRYDGNLVLCEFGLLDNFFCAKVIDNFGKESNWVCSREGNQKILEIGEGQPALYKLGLWVSDQI